MWSLSLNFIHFTNSRWFLIRKICHNRMVWPWQRHITNDKCWIGITRCIWKWLLERENRRIFKVNGFWQLFSRTGSTESIIKSLHLWLKILMCVKCSHNLQLNWINYTLLQWIIFFCGVGWMMTYVGWRNKKKYFFHFFYFYN